MSSEAPVRTRGGLIAVAAAAGVLAGTVAVYVSQSGDGNVALTTADCAEALKAAARAAPFAKGEVAAFRVAKAADPLDDLRFLGPDGQSTGIGDLAGKTLLVNFWATWCIPCRAEMPTLDRLAKARNGDDFQVIAIDLDVSDAARRAPAFLADIGVEHLPFYSDPSLGGAERDQETRDRHRPADDAAGRPARLPHRRDRRPGGCGIRPTRGRSSTRPWRVRRRDRVRQKCARLRLGPDGGCAAQARGRRRRRSLRSPTRGEPSRHRLTALMKTGGACAPPVGSFSVAKGGL